MESWMLSPRKRLPKSRNFQRSTLPKFSAKSKNLANIQILHSPPSRHPHQWCKTPPSPPCTPQTPMTAEMPVAIWAMFIIAWRQRKKRYWWTSMIQGATPKTTTKMPKMTIWIMILFHRWEITQEPGLTWNAYDAVLSYEGRELSRIAISQSPLTSRNGCYQSGATLRVRVYEDSFLYCSAPAKKIAKWPSYGVLKKLWSHPWSDHNCQMQSDGHLSSGSGSLWAHWGYKQCILQNVFKVY